jgi:hypothetical protein
MFADRRQRQKKISSISGFICDIEEDVHVHRSRRRRNRRSRGTGAPGEYASRAPYEHIEGVLRRAQECLKADGSVRSGAAKRMPHTHAKCEIRTCYVRGGRRGTPFQRAGRMNEKVEARELWGHTAKTAWRARTSTTHQRRQNHEGAAYNTSTVGGIWCRRHRRR